MKSWHYMMLFAFGIALQNFAIGEQYVPEWRKNLPASDEKNDEKKSIYYGAIDLSDKVSENLTIYGPAHLEKVNISNKTLIKGPVAAKDSSFHDIQIDGVANFDHVKAQKLEMHGPLYARKSQIEEGTITSNEAAFSESQVKKLTIKKDRDDDRKPRIYLDKGSKIDYLNFESKNGRVILGDESSAVRKLEGGQIETKQ